MHGSKLRVRVGVGGGRVLAVLTDVDIHKAVAGGRLG
jgi:hypothetical protein